MQATETGIDITSTELHKYLKRFAIVHPQMEDAAEITHAAIEERWPGVDHATLALAAHINQLAADRVAIARDASRDPSTYIDTHAQGDLFNSYPVRVPKWFIIGGRPIEYWKVSLPEALEFHRAREQAQTSEAEAFEEAARAKRRHAADARTQVEQTLRLIEIAHENGIDPSTVTYERVEEEE